MSRHRPAAAAAAAAAADSSLHRHGRLRRCCLATAFTAVLTQPRYTKYSFKGEATASKGGIPNQYNPVISHHRPAAAANSSPRSRCCLRRCGLASDVTAVLTRPRHTKYSAKEAAKASKGEIPAQIPAFFLKPLQP